MALCAATLGVKATSDGSVVFLLGAGYLSTGLVDNRSYKR